MGDRRGKKRLLAELSERGDLFTRFSGGINPSALPRKALAPISISVSGTVKTLCGERPPPLRSIKIELNRGGGALVGEGLYAASTAFPEQAIFSSQGRILAFNGVYGGREAILAYIYGTEPVPITRILVFHIHASFPFARTSMTFADGRRLSSTLTRSCRVKG